MIQALHHSAGTSAPSVVDGLRPLAQQKADDATPPSAVDALLDERRRAQDDMVAALEAQLKATADSLARAVEDYITTQAGSTETARIRAQVYQTQLGDLLALLEREGIADARAEWYRGYAQIAGLAEETLAAGGVDGADRALDSEGAQASIRAIRDQQSEELWTGAISRPMATRILAGLRSSIEMQPLAEAARIIARDESTSVPQAVTLARTRIAEYDRWVGNEAARQADPEGDLLMWAYVGPTLDGITRPFCGELRGRYFTRDQVGRLDNHQPGTGHPSISGGGYNCRHAWIQLPESLLLKRGYVKGTDADVAAANAAAER